MEAQQKEGVERVFADAKENRVIHSTEVWPRSQDESGSAMLP